MMSSNSPVQRWIRSLPWTGLLVAVAFFTLGMLTPILVDEDKNSGSGGVRSGLVRNSGAGRSWLEALLSIDSSLFSSRSSGLAGAGTGTGSDAADDDDLADEDYYYRDSSTPYDCDDEDELRQFMHNEPQLGMHVVCISENEHGQLKLRFFKHAHEEVKPAVEGLLSPVPWSNLEMIFRSKLRLPATTTPAAEDPSSTQQQQQPPWVVYSGKGEWIVAEHEREVDVGHFSHRMSNRHGIVLLFENGLFRWPGVHISFRRKIDLYSIMPHGSPDVSSYVNTTAVLETVSLYPLVFSIDGFLSDDECNHIRAKAEPRLQKPEGGSVDAAQYGHIPADDDKILTEIDYRIASLARIPRTYQEQLLVQRFDFGEKLLIPHADYYERTHYYNDPKWKNQVQGGRRRMVSVYGYLNDVRYGGGGETSFPRFNGGIEKVSEDCKDGLNVRPKKGKILLVYSMTADGRMDPHNLHGSCPLTDEGDFKWLATKWIWNENIVN